MNVINLKIEQIKPYENNPRHNEKAIQYVANSITEYGFRQPITVDERYVIITGHTRYEAAIYLGLTQIPCVIAKDLSPEQVKAYRLVDNKANELAIWDTELLQREIEELANLEIDMSLFDFGEDLYEEINYDNLEQPEPFEFVVKIGKRKVYLEESEFNDLLTCYNQYTEKNGVSFGFFKELIHGRNN